MHTVTGSERNFLFLTTDSRAQQLFQRITAEAEKARAKSRSSGAQAVVVDVNEVFVLEAPDMDHLEV